MKDKKLIFMATPFRSGSALTSRMLNAHSQVAMVCDQLKYFRFCYDRYNPLTDDNVKKMLNDVAARLHRRFDITINVDGCFHEIQSKTKSDASIYSTLLQNIIKETNKTIIGEVECLSWSRIPVFLDMFPNSKALLIIRDLRDVVVSFKKLTIAPGNDYLIALFNVIDAMDHFIEYQNNFPDRFYGIRFEELKKDPQNEMKKVCNFLGIEYEPGIIDEDKWTDYQGKKWENRKISSFYDLGDHQNPVERWRRLITPEELYLCEWIGKAQMLAFNMNFEEQLVSQETIDNAIEMITSSKILNEAFKNWSDTGRGVQMYPLDPANPSTWTENQ